MKKIIALLISISMVIALAACSGTAPATTAAPAETTAEESTTAGTGDATSVSIDNDGETKITDAAYDQYFEGTAAEGVAALLDAGKCYINGVKIPATEDETEEFQINWVKSLWKTDAGWCYNVHKYTGADNMSFVDARKDLFDMTATIRGHKTTFYLDADGHAESINIESFEVMRVAEIEDMGHDTVLHRGNFELETQRVRYDVDLVHFPTENVDSEIAVGDVAVFWYGNNEEPGGTAQWHAVRAIPLHGVISQPEKGAYTVNAGQADEFSSKESNVSRYNLIDCSRPTQGYSVYTTLGLTDREIVLWNTPNNYPIGFTFGLDKEESKANLLAGIENAKAFAASVTPVAAGEAAPEGVPSAAQEDIDAFNAAIEAAEAVANKNSSTQFDIDWAMWELRSAWDDGKEGGFIAAVAGLPEKEEEGAKDDKQAENDPNKVVWNNDGETKITDAAFDQYFDGTAVDGVAALLDAGKCSINGLPLPATEGEMTEYQINLTKSLWKTDAGWCYNVHKYTGADNMSFVDARKDLFDMTSTIRGHETVITLDPNTKKAAAIDIQSFEVTKIVYFEDHGGSVDKLDRGEFELETQRIRYDLNNITAIESKNWDPAIKFGDIICYWNGADGWHAVKAGSHTGVVTKDPDTKEYIVDNDWRMIESNVSRYNLIDDSRPTQAFNAYVRTGLQEAGVPIILWVTPNDFPIGFSYGDGAKDALAKAIENAKALMETVQVSADGKDVASGKWAPQFAFDDFNAAIAAAEEVNAKNSSSSWAREKALYALAQAWGEGGEKPSGFVGEIGEN